MTDNTQPEALRLSERISDVMCAAEKDARAIARAADELVRQHTRIAELEAEIVAIGAGGVSAPLMGQPQAMPDLSALTERGAKAWAGFDAQGYRDWVLRNLPKGSIIGNGEWWADHLTSWAKRFVKAAPQPSPTPQADSQPEDENDAHNFAICQHFDHWLIEKGALLTPHSEESDGPMAPALNWIASVEAMVAARAPADSVTAPAGGIPGNFITHRASWRKALETSKAHATGDDVTYWDHELRAFDRSFDRLWELMQASPTPPAEQQAQSAGPCVICGSDEPFTGTCGSGDPRALCKQAAPNAAPGVGNSGFDHKTAADLLNNKTVSDEAVRKFVATSRWAHDERAALSATLLAMHGVLTSREAEIALLKKALLEAEAAPQQEAQEPCPTCAALARTVMLDQVSFDRKPDCYGIRQITDDEGVEEWEDIRTSPDVAREEANDMMATGRGEIYEVVPLYTAPQPVARVPLTDEHIRAMLNKHPPEDVCGWSYRMGIDDAEDAHGIKGGQHGADTRSN